MSANRQLTSKEQAVANIIESHNALISIVFDTAYDANTLGYKIDYTEVDQNYLNQLADPTQNRPSRSADFFADATLPQYDISLEDKPLNEAMIQQAKREK